MRNQHHLDIYDSQLAQYRPFGDSDYLHEQLQVRYGGRLQKISAFMRVARELSRALDQATARTRYHTIGDPVVRHTVQEALRQVVRGTHDGLPLAACEDIFRETIRHLERGACAGPLESGVAERRRLGTDPHHGYVWSEEHPDDVFGRRFRGMIRDYFPAEASCTPRPGDFERLTKGAELLDMLLPVSSRSALSHARVVVAFHGRKASCSDFRVGGTILINRDMLGNPWWVAEHLLHESLHQKLYDFRHTHSLLKKDLSPQLSSSSEGAATIDPIWNAGGANGSTHWDTFRSVAAFHVYVHLALFCLQAERRKAELVNQFGAADGSLPAPIQWHKAFERAQYLGRKIKEYAWQELGPAGRLLVDWLLSTLNAIDAVPPPPESVYLHLLLERYATEATLMANKSLSPELATQLAKLMNDEAETVHGLLTASEAGREDVERLDDAVARRSDEGAEAAFLRFRTTVTTILQALSPDGYGLHRPSSAEASAPELMIKTMVERSSQQLLSLLDGRP